MKYVLWLLLLPIVFGTTYYVDPATGNINNPGTAQEPWSTLQEIFENDLIETNQCTEYPCNENTPLEIKNPGAPVKSGDTLILMDGYHGDITYDIASQFHNTVYITIKAGENQEPQLKRLNMRGSSKWIFSGLYISPSFVSPYEDVGTLVSFNNHNWQGPIYDMTIRDSTLYSVWDATSWDADDWNNLPANAISLPDDTKAINNYIKNIDFGISGGANVLVENNTIENFAGDGIRGLGDYGVYRYNTIKNCYDVNANHDDGFQSWSVGEDGVGTGVVKGIKIIGNTIINYETDYPLKGTLQGIGCFDGMFEDWVVADNLVVTDHWHGITLMGSINSRIENNTVVDINNERPGPAWIRISNHKDGTTSTGTISGNIMTSLNSENVETFNNLQISYDEYEDYFVDPANFDFRLKCDTPCIGSRMLCMDCGQTCEGNGYMCCEKCSSQENFDCAVGSCCQECCLSASQLISEIEKWQAGTTQLNSLMSSISSWKCQSQQ